ncbi:MAG: hypothetical protein IT303_00555 [Dehalococcoidia bacterium]|nr:hypothetical protein [Dehalococcoidia bacterium]
MNAPTPCSATTRAGNSCRFSARKETGLCINHDPAYAERQLQNRQRGTRIAAENRARLPIRIDDFDLSNRSSVQALVDAVLRLVIAGEMTEARASQVIRLLSIAVRNFGATHTQIVPHLNIYEYRRNQAITHLVRMLDR